MDWLARAADTAWKMRMGTPVILNQISVAMGLQVRFAHSLYYDQDQIFRDTSRQVEKRNPGVAICGHGGVSSPIVASH